MFHFSCVAPPSLLSFDNSNSLIAYTISLFTYAVKRLFISD
nr:MAG TPA_asm: hypothetical protein [Caudoviricetes sp.]